MTRNNAHHDKSSSAIEPDAARIVEAALVHVPFDGWSDAALKAGATDAGMDANVVARLFPAGPLDAVILHSAMADQAMVAEFEAMDDRPDRVHLMIREMILIRLRHSAANKEAVRRALTLLAVPQNALASARALYSTVDAMWRAAGQRDTDFSFYTKRATLAAVYSATLLAWIADTSGDMTNIEGFLDRRLQEVAKIPKASAPVRGIMASGQRFAEGVFGAVSRRARN